jgi:SMODS-associating 4TM effector domain
MNNISKEQNSQHRLELLSAQYQLYSDAKDLQLLSIIISIPVVIVVSILVAKFPQFAVYAGLWGIIATFLELLVFSRLQKSTQEKAAKIQQMFDCEVLQFNWANLNCEFRVEPETIDTSITKYKSKNPNFSKLQNWYPVSVDKLPIHQARIICQRANVWWDAQLRRRYAQWTVVILISLTVIVLMISLIGGLTLEKFLLVVINPLLPAFSFGLRQYIEHNEAAIRLDRLRETAEVLVQEVINKKYTPQDLERESYSLQTQIYDNRRRNPLILDCFYSQLKNKDEEKMNKGAEFLVQELMQHP